MSNPRYSLPLKLSRRMDFHRKLRVPGEAEQSPLEEIAEGNEIATGCYKFLVAVIYLDRPLPEETEPSTVILERGS